MKQHQHTHIQKVGIAVATGGFFAFSLALPAFAGAMPKGYSDAGGYNPTNYQSPEAELAQIANAPTPAAPTANASAPAAQAANAQPARKKVEADDLGMTDYSDTGEYDPIGPGFAASGN